MQTAAHREVASHSRRALLSVCWKPENLRRTVLIALVVGMIFTLVNQLPELLRGDGNWVTGVKLAINFGVPFVVSNLGVLTAARTGRT